MSRQTGDGAVQKIIENARVFRANNLATDGIASSFGYFTKHPFASLNRKRLAAILNLLDEISSAGGRKPLRVLDVACGGGIITSAISALGHKALGVDTNESEIQLAALFSRNHGSSALSGALSGALFRKVDVLEDPNWEQDAKQALGGIPDVVVLAYALHHLKEPWRLLDRLAAWLDSGSCLLINEENPDSPLFRLKHRLRGFIQNDTECEFHRSYAQWRSLLETSGFAAVGAPIALDLMPVLPLLAPSRSWSLVFTARRS